MVSFADNSPQPSGGRNGRPESPWYRDHWVVSVCTDKGFPIPARMCETGATEVRVQTDRPIAFGTTLRLAICTNFHSVVAVTEAVVHHCQPADSGWWLGLFLKARLPEGLLSDPSADNRSEIRYDVNWRAWLRNPETGDLTSAMIVNYSLSGIRLQVPHSMDTNQWVDLLKSPSTDAKPVTALRVQWCRQEADRDFSVVARIPDRNGRLIPVAFYAFTGLEFGPSTASANRIHADVRADRLQFTVPNAEF